MRTCLILTFLFATSALADEVHLTDGRVLSGKIVDEGKRICLVDRDRKYAIKKSRIEKIVEKPSFMDEYAERLEKLPEEDAEAIFEFGRWLESNEWKTRARRAFEEVLELDPEHRGARRALGYKLYEGEWVSPDELNRRRGLVYFEGDGRWYTKHDLAELRKEIERNEKLRQTIEERRRVTDKVNHIARGFATFDKKKRKRTYDELYTYAEQLNSPELRKFADDAKAYYDRLAKILCAQMKARVEIHATQTKLRKPIQTFETQLGQAIAFISGQNPVKIQLPEISIAEIHSTAEIPAGCE